MEEGVPASHRVQRIGDYAVVRVLGEGGMGIVYEALERLTHRRVALKVLHSSLTKDRDAQHRFFNEMRILARLEHPNIVRSLSNVEIEGRLVMVLELLTGRTLREELDAVGPLPASRAISIAIMVGSALAAAHELEPCVVHRDLKPENIMLLHDGTVRVMDFGVAKILATGAATQATQVVGTVQYMSPEQAEGRAITRQTDLYALGLVLYEMLGGRPPFESPSLMGLLRHHCETPPPPLPEERRRDLAPHLEALLYRLLEKAPERRPESARAVVAELGAARAPAPVQTSIQAVTTRKKDTIELVNRFEQKRRWPFVVGGLGVIGVAGAVAVTLLASGKSAPKKASARARVSTDETAAGPKTAVAPVAGCPMGRTCTPLKQLDPTAVDVDRLLQESLDFALSLDPGSVLGMARFDNVLGNGVLDLTMPERSAMLTYDLPVGSILMDVTPTRLEALRFDSEYNGTVLPGPPCSYRTAWQAASGRMAFDAKSEASVHLDGHGKPVWRFGTRDAMAMVDAVTCVIRP